MDKAGSSVMCYHCSPRSPFLKWWWSESDSTEHQHHIRELHLGQYKPFRCYLPKCKQTFTLEAFFDSHSERNHVGKRPEVVVSPSNYLEMLTKTMMHCNHLASNNNSDLACKLLKTMTPQPPKDEEPIETKAILTPAIKKEENSMEIVEISDHEVNSSSTKPPTAISLSRVTSAGQNQDIFEIEQELLKLDKTFSAHQALQNRRKKSKNRSVKNRKAKAHASKLSQVVASSSLPLRARNKTKKPCLPCSKISPKTNSTVPNDPKPKQKVSKAIEGGAMICKVCGCMCDAQSDHIWLYHMKKRRFECSKCGAGFGPGQKGQAVSHIVREHRSRGRLIDNRQECVKYERIYNQCFPVVRASDF